MPTLIQQHKKSVVETRLAKFYSTINQAIKMSETVNGDVRYWDGVGEVLATSYSGWETDGDGNPDKTKPPKALGWYNKYLKNYLNTIQVDYEKNSSEGKVMAYFEDGSLMLFSSSSIIFYPNAKDYKTTPDNNGNNDRDNKVSGVKYFTFMTPHYLYNKNKMIEPYIPGNWKGTKEELYNNAAGCSPQITAREHACCTKLIQMNGWKIPDDYPFKF